jgi:hypothetical protein
MKKIIFTDQAKGDVRRIDQTTAMRNLPLSIVLPRLVKAT